MIEVSELMPLNFKPQVQVAAIYLEIDDKILLLQNVSKEPGKWGVPAGKLELRETPEQAAQRELFEETSIALSALEPLTILYMRKPTIGYIYHMFRGVLKKIPPVQLSSEHQQFAWVSLSKASAMPLMAGAEEALQIFVKKRSL